MRRLIRLFVVFALAVLVVPAAASAGTKSKPAAWAAKHKLKGAWKAKDADRDGLKNLKEFKLRTNPRKADTDRDGLKDGHEVASSNNPLKPDTDGDGVKDGAEHAGVVTEFDGETVVLRQFTGPKLTAVLECGDDAFADDSLADEDYDDEDLGDFDEGDEDWEEDDFTVESSAVRTDDECDLEEGDVLKSAEFERIDGETLLVAFELA